MRGGRGGGSPIVGFGLGIGEDMRSERRARLRAQSCDSVGTHTHAACSGAGHAVGHSQRKGESR